MLLSAALLLSACGEVKNETAVSGTVSDIPSTDVETAAPAETTNVIYQNEVENNMNVYKIKTFDSIDTVDWDSVTAAAVNTYKWVECEKYETFAKLVYVKDYGFLCRMTCLEDSPVATYTEFGDTVCLDSCMEFFAIFDGGDNYLNFESNALGTMCLEYGISRESRRTALRYLKKDEMFVVTPEVEEGRWSVTIDIPITKLQEFYGDDLTAETFVSGYTFTGNFYKTGGKENTGNEHYAMWNEVGTDVPDFHRPEYFGKLVIE